MAASVRRSLGLDLQADLTCGMLRELTFLTANARGIQSLVGIQNLIGVTGITLEDNQISDISPLGGLTIYLSRLGTDRTRIREWVPDRRDLIRKTG